MHAFSENRENSSEFKNSQKKLFAAVTESEGRWTVEEAEMQRAGHHGHSGTVGSGASRTDRWSKTQTKEKLKFKRLESHHSQQGLTEIIFQDLSILWWHKTCCPLYHAVFFMKDIVYFAPTLAVHTILQTILVFTGHLTNQCCFEKKK